jgi:hypothetical protein
MPHNGSSSRKQNSYLRDIGCRGRAQLAGLYRLQGGAGGEHYYWCPANGYHSANANYGSTSTSRSFYLTKCD